MTDQTPNQVQAKVNAVPWNNRIGLVTGPIMLGLLTSIIGLFVLYGSLAGNNVWTGSNNFINTVNPKNAPYSAKGDNLANDTGSLQAAINAAPALGARVYIPAGNYLIYGTEWVPSNSLIECDPGTTIYEMTQDPVFMNSGANFNWAADYTPATLANVRNSNISIQGCTVSYMQATATQTDTWPFGPGLAAFTLSQYVHIYGNTVLGDPTGLDRNHLTSGVRYAKVFNAEAEDNIVNGGVVGAGVWGGSQNINIKNNTWNIAHNYYATTNAFSCSNINGMGTALNDHQATAHVQYDYNACNIAGAESGVAKSVAYNNGALSAGSSVTDLESSNNNTIATGSNNICYGANGNLNNFTIDNDWIEGCDTQGYVLSAHAVSWGSLTDPFTTTSGSGLVVVTIPGVLATQPSNVVVGNYLSVPVGTPAVGGLTLAGYYPITAVANGQVTINAGSNASSGATGGGTLSLATYWGTVRNSRVLNMHFKNVSKPNDGLVIVEGPNNVVANTSIEGGTYGAVTLTSSLDCCSALTPIPNILYGNQGPAGTGVSSPYGGFAVSGDNVNAWQTNYTPVVLDYAAISSQGTWTPVVKFGGAATGVTYSTQAGQYWKTGAQVQVCGQIALSNVGSATGSVTIAGLPFGPHPGPAYSLLLAYWANTSGLTVAPIVTTGVGGSTTLAMFTNSTWTTPVANTNFSNTTVLNFCGQYVTP
jgi:hypothetical protein